MVLVAKFESRRDIWTVESPTVTGFEGNNQEFSFLQDGSNLGAGEEIVFIEKSASDSISISFRVCIEQSKLISMRVKA